MNLQKQNKTLQSQRDQKLLSLQDSSYEDAYYFTDQLSELKKKLQSRTKQADMLTAIGTKVIPDFNGSPGTMFNSLIMTDDGGSSKFQGEIIIPDFNALAAQLRAFSMINGAANVLMGDVQRTDAGQLKAAVSFRLSPAVPEKTTDKNSSSGPQEPPAPVPAQ